MFAYIVRRILATVPVMAVVAVFVFALLHLSPGDPAAIIAGDTATEADIAGIRAKLGLDQPIWVQYGRYLAALEARAPAGAWRTRHQLRVARLIARSALERRESRGGHRRVDFPPADWPRIEPEPLGLD